MNNFAFSSATDVDAALTQLGPIPDGTSLAHAALPRFIAGGTNLIDLMKENLLWPARLVDINRLPLDGIDTTPEGGLMLGALARNAETARHPLVRERYPLLSAAIMAGASPQIRNMASNGGNLLQRTRCVYFYDAGVPCNKRVPGSGCPARTGLARQHAVLGTSDQCIATHPSDMCVALAALDAVVHVESTRGSRRIAFSDFHRLPGDRPEVDSTLAADEIITGIELPPAAGVAANASYLKLRERASYAFALVSVAVALDIEAGTIRGARIALGGVAHKPWRDREAEALLQGQQPGDALFEQVAARLLHGAQAFGEGPGSNAFKIPMARRAVVRALQMAVRGELSNTGLCALENDTLMGDAA